MARYVSGSAAVDFGQEAFEQEVAVQEPRHLTVLPGARTRRQEQTQAQTQTVLSPIAVTAIKCAVAFALVLAVLSVAYIGLTAAAFDYAAQNTRMSSQLDEARSLASELEVQLSVYSNPDRIRSLATDAYGMVPAADTAVIDLSAVAAAAEAPADQDAAADVPVV